MPQSFRHAKPLSYKYSLIETFVSDKVLVGIGNTLTPWVIEGSPPEVDVSLDEQAEISIFLPPTMLTAAIPFPSAGEEVVLSGDNYYVPIGNSYNSIKLANATDILVQAKLVHAEAQTSTVSYRSIGVHNHVELTEQGEELFESGNSIPASEVISSRLVYVKNIKPIQIQSNIIEFINLVIPA